MALMSRSNAVQTVLRAKTSTARMWNQLLTSYPCVVLTRHVLLNSVYAFAVNITHEIRVYEYQNL